MSWRLGPAQPRTQPQGIDVWKLELAGDDPGARRAAAREALREVLGRYLGIAAEELDLHAGEHGKPRLRIPGEDLQFNLSHSRNLALIAIHAERPVGVDVEWSGRERDFLALAERALDAEALAQVQAASGVERRRAFYAAWVRHEARLKCGGGGIGGPEPAGPVAIADLPVGSEYAAAVAVAGAETGPPRLYRLDLH